MESEAIRQLENTLRLPGMVRAVGMPDLHPGKGSPVGASFLARGVVYPHLIGNDIGCGMRFSMVSSKNKSFHGERWAKRITDAASERWEGKDTSHTPGQESLPRDHFSHNSERWLHQDFDSSLGTVGRGNHFVEFQTPEQIFDSELFERLGISRRGLYLLVHSGSRGLGNSILMRHIEAYKHGGLEASSEAFHAYLREHDFALRWRLFRGMAAEL